MEAETFIAPIVWTAMVVVLAQRTTTEATNMVTRDHSLLTLHPGEHKALRNPILATKAIMAVTTWEIEWVIILRLCETILRIVATELLLRQDLWGHMVATTCTDRLPTSNHLLNLWRLTIPI